MKAATLLQPGPGSLAVSDANTLWRNACITALGFAVYGFTAGVWRSPLMGLYVAVKMPLMIALTLSFNSLLNGLLGTLLGGRLGLTGSLNALLGAFAISALILGSLAPVMLFFTGSMPPPDSPSAGIAHAALILSHTLLIAIAGLAGVVRLGRLLADHAVSLAAARATLAAWIVGNAFLGSQFSWILRPFFGSPGMEVAFLRPNPLRGSFHETLWSMATRMFGSPENLFAPVSFILILLLFGWILRYDQKNQPRIPQ